MTDEPIKVSREQYFLQAGERMSTMWGEIASDDVVAAAWLAGEIEMVVDCTGVVLRRPDTGMSLADDEYPGNYL